MKRSQIILSVILSTFYLLLTTSIAHAANLGLSFSPSIVEATIKPGKTVTQAFSLTNLSDHDQVFIARVVPFAPGDSQGNPSLKPNLRPDWLKYFSLSNTNLKLDEPFTLGANQDTQVILTILVPDKAAYSDLYATLLVTSVVKDTPGASSSFGAAIGSNLIITISPQGRPPALVKITNFYPDKNSFLFHYADYYIADNLNSVSFVAVAKNLGKYFTKTSGTLSIDRGDNNVSTQTLLANNILANSERNLEGSPSGELIFHPSITSMGVYRASLNLRSENSSSHGELTLLILPLKLASGLLISIVIFILGFRFAFPYPHKSL